jgi:hypothetical protein
MIAAANANVVAAISPDQKKLVIVATNSSQTASNNVSFRFVEVRRRGGYGCRVPNFSKSGFGKNECHGGSKADCRYLAGLFGQYICCNIEIRARMGSKKRLTFCKLVSFRRSSFVIRNIKKH